MTVEKIDIFEFTHKFVEGSVVLSFTEYDPSHFTDGPREASMDFVFDWETAELTVSCREANHGND